MQNFIAPKLETFMGVRSFSLFRYHLSTLSIESVWLIMVYIESQIIWFMMHHRGSVKMGNMGIANPSLNQ